MLQPPQNRIWFAYETLPIERDTFATILEILSPTLTKLPEHLAFIALNSHKPDTFIAAITESSELPATMMELRPFLKPPKPKIKILFERP